jgi:hypothetical protein
MRHATAAVAALLAVVGAHSVNAFAAPRSFRSADCPSFEAVQAASFDTVQAALSDLRPALWADPPADLTDWPGFSSAATPSCASCVAMNLTELVLNPSTPLTGTLNLSALSTTVPISVIVAPHLTTIVALTSLPTALITLELTDSIVRPVADATGGTDGYANFTALPPTLARVVLRNASLTGVIDVSHLTPAMNVGHLDLSQNAGLCGGVELFAQPLGNPHTNLLYNFQETGIDVVVVPGPGLAAYVTTEPTWFMGAGYVYMDPGYVIKVTNLQVPATLAVGTYCRLDPVDSTVMDIMQVVPNSQDGHVYLRLLTGAEHSCEMLLLDQFASGIDGYVQGSTAWASGVAACMGFGGLPADATELYYAQMMPSVGTEIALVFTRQSLNTSETMAYTVSFTDCATGTGATMSDYYSTALSNTTFLDLLISFNGTRMQSFTNGGYLVCPYNWPVVYRNWQQCPVPPPPNVPCPATLYNLPHVLAAWRPCLVPPSETNPALPADTNWTSAAFSGGDDFAFATDPYGLENALTLNKFGFAPVAAGQYCFIAVNKQHTISVSSNGSVTATSTLPSGKLNASASWDGVLVFQTAPQVPSATTGDFDFFASAVAAINATLPSYDMNGDPYGTWNATKSTYALYPGSYIYGSIQLEDGAGRAATYSPFSCGFAVPDGEFCAQVDLGNSFVSMAVNESVATLTYLVKRPMVVSGQQISQAVGLVYTCGSQHRPLWTSFAIQGEERTFLGDVAGLLADWSACLPSATDTMVLTPPFTGGYYAPTYGSVEQAIYIMAATPTEQGLASTPLQLVPSVCRSGVASRYEEPKGGACTAVEYIPSVETLLDSADATKCSLGLCDQLRTVYWQPSTGMRAWTTAFATTRRLVPVDTIAVPIAGGVDVASCLPYCYVGSDSCGLLAAWLLNASACVISRGGFTTQFNLSSLPLPAGWNAAPSTCSDGSTGQAQLASVLAFMATPASAQQAVFQCDENGAGRVFVVAGNSAFRLAVETNALSMTCSVCAPFLTQDTTAMPYTFIFASAAINIVLILVTNYLVDPFVGPGLTKVKLALCAPPLLLSQRERARYRQRISGRLNPGFIEEIEIETHIRVVEDAVDLHMREGGLEPFESSRDVNDSLTDELQAMLTRIDGTGKKRFAVAYRAILMDHGCLLHDASLQKPSVMQDLVELRKACNNASSANFLAELDSQAGSPKTKDLNPPRDPDGSDYLAPPMSLDGARHDQSFVDPAINSTSGPARASFSPTSRALDDEYDIPSVSVFRKESIATSSIARCLLALENNVDAEWRPVTLAREWLDRRSLIPKDWLLAVQLLLLLVFYVVCVVKAVREGGHGNCARGESGYSAFRAFQTTYFYFLNSSMPGAYLVNCAFRSVYGHTLKKSLLKKSVWSQATERTKQLLTDTFIAPLLLLLLPAAMNIVPMAIMFIPVPIVNVIIVGSCHWLTGRFQPPSSFAADRRAFALALAVRLLMRYASTVLAVAGLQSTFNFGVLVYNEHTGWGDTVSVDYHSRSLLCAADHLSATENDAFRHVLMLVS